MQDNRIHGPAGNQGIVLINPIEKFELKNLKGVAKVVAVALAILVTVGLAVTARKLFPKKLFSQADQKDLTRQLGLINPVVMQSRGVPKGKLKVAIDQHTDASQAIINELPKTGMQGKETTQVEIVSPSIQFLANEDFTTLDPLFTAQYSSDVGADIKRDSHLDDVQVLYSVASQFNSAESSSTNVVPMEFTIQAYKNDRTQGPQAQLAFEDQQVIAINRQASHFNGLVHVLDKNTLSAFVNGYLMPQTAKQLEALNKAIREKGHLIEYLCVNAVPKGGENKVCTMMVAAPALSYMRRIESTKEFSQDKIDEMKKELSFLCAFYGYKAQFEQALALKQNSSEKKVIFKPAAVGTGVFANDTTSVAKGFYAAAKLYEQQLKASEIEVKFQVFKRPKGKPSADAMKIVNLLGLKFPK